MVEQRGFGSENWRSDLESRSCPFISSGTWATTPHHLLCRFIPHLGKVFYTVPVIDIHILFCSTIKSLLLSPQVDSKDEKP